MTDSVMTKSPTVQAQHLSDADFESTINSAGTPVLIDFYAVWCGPCKLAAPIIDKLAGELKGKVAITKLDVDQNPMMTQKYGVMSIPTVIILQNKDGKIVELDRKVGFPGEQGYRQMLSKIMPQDAA